MSLFLIHQVNQSSSLSPQPPSQRLPLCAPKSAQCTAKELSGDDAVNCVSVFSCETVNVYVLRGLRGLIHLPVYLSAHKVCTRQRQAEVGAKINK